VPEPHIVDRELVEALLLVVLDDGCPRREQSLRVRVPLGRRQMPDDVDEDLFRCVEAEGAGIADVQLDDPAALLFESLGLLQDRSPDVVADVLQLGRLTQIHPATMTYARGPGTSSCRVPQ